MEGRERGVGILGGKEGWMGGGRRGREGKERGKGKEGG